MWIIFVASAIIVPVLQCQAGSLINRGESWPRMPNYDIWGSPDHQQHEQERHDFNHQNSSAASLLTATNSAPSKSSAGTSRRNGKGGYETE